MANIDLKNDKPGILSLFEYRKDVAMPMRMLAEATLRKNCLGQSTAELIAAYVSYNNKCEFCYLSHLEAFKQSTELDIKTVVRLTSNMANLLNEVEPPLRALLMLAEQVRIQLRPLEECIEYCKMNKVSDEEIHDTVLISSVMCMYNRYVEGLATPKAQPIEYMQMGERMVRHGYY